MVKRIIVGCILIPLVIFIIFTKYTFLLWFSLVLISLILTYEMLSFFPEKMQKGSRIILYGSVLGFYFVKMAYFNFLFISSSVYHSFMFASIFIELLLLGYFEVFQKNFENSAFRVAYGLLIFSYGTYFLSFIYDLKYIHVYDSRIGIEMGSYYILYASAICWLFDTGAYFGGKFFGKKKLGLASSPNKTWVGLLSGLFFSVVGLSLVKFFLSSKIDVTMPIFHFSFFNFVLLSAFLGLNSQLGDLFESVLKRSAGVKDSSGLIPGHGGIFDRTDSLIPTYFLVFIIIYTEIS